MKRQPLTVGEVLRELRAQVRVQRAQAKGAVDAVTREHTRHAIEALTFAVRYIKARQVTVRTLQQQVDDISQKLATGHAVIAAARKHGVIK
jgi:hypothetical protein